MSTVRPGLSDGRCFTNYESAWQLNEDLKKKYNITDNRKYREFLEQNAKKIMSDTSKITATTKFADCNCMSCLTYQKAFDVNSDVYTSAKPQHKH